MTYQIIYDYGFPRVIFDFPIFDAPAYEPIDPQTLKGIAYVWPDGRMHSFLVEAYLDLEKADEEFRRGLFRFIFEMNKPDEEDEC